MPSKKRYNTEQTAPKVQNGQKIFKVSQIYLNQQGTKNQCQVEANQLKKCFPVLSEKNLASKSNVPVNLNPSEDINQSIFPEEISENQVYSTIN